MNSIELKLRMFLEAYANGEKQISPEHMSEYLDNVARILSIKRDNKFTYRLSSIGKPLCQLQLEKNGVKGSGLNYTDAVKFAIGNLLEPWVVMMLRSAGVNIQGYQIPVKINLEGLDISGTLDLDIDDGIWDIKTASKFGFSKFSEAGGLDSVVESDSFGYLGQGFTYASAIGKPFKGWIVVNKDGGDIAVCEVSSHFHDQYRDKALNVVKNNIKALQSNLPFEKLFQDIEEKFYGKPTGNRILGYPCAACQFRGHCWPDAKYLPNPASKARSKKFAFYTLLKPVSVPVEDKQNETEAPTRIRTSDS